MSGITDRNKQDCKICKINSFNYEECSMKIDTYEYKYNDQHYEWMMEQQWEAREFGVKYYHELAVHEWNQIHQYLGHPKTVLELGCGLGRSSVYVNYLLQDDSIQYILADRDGRTTNTGAFNPVQDEFYNDLEQTEDFCKLNGIKNVMTFDTEDDWSKLPKVDFVLSTCSFGMHVPIERYIERILSVTEANCTLVFGTRSPTYGPNSFRNLFEEVIFQPGINRMPEFPLENWLILRNPIQR